MGASLVPRIGTTRRLHALAYMGQDTHFVLAEILNKEADQIAWHPEYPYIRREIHEKVLQYYEKNCMKVGPAKFARQRARLWSVGLQIPGHEWASPLAWDGINMDDPRTKPKGVSRGRRRDN